MEQTAIPTKGRIPGDEGVWVLIFGELFVFGLFFLVFSYYQALSPALYEESRQLLDADLGLANTLILLTSSWFVARGVQYARDDDFWRSRRLFLIALLCGVLFIVLKAFEYSHKFAAGIDAMTNDFFMYYFVLTGLHLLHVVAGIAALAFAILTSRNVAHAKSAGNAMSGIKTYETVATFWHLVDLLWVVIFALLYLMG